MITHKNLVDAVCRSIDPWTCPREDCPNDHGCRECAERLVTEYENSLRADEHDKEVVRKFAEWIERNFNEVSCLYSDCEGRDCFDAEKALAKYERHHNG